MYEYVIIYVRMNCGVHVGFRITQILKMEFKKMMMEL